MDANTVFISVDEARFHLRDDEASNTSIQVYIDGVLQSVETFLGRSLVTADYAASNVSYDANTQVVFSPDIKVAALLQLGDLYANREDHEVSLTNSCAKDLLIRYRVGWGI
jgi:hypothetical protein